MKLKEKGKRQRQSGKNIYSKDEKQKVSMPLTTNEIKKNTTSLFGSQVETKAKKRCKKFFYATVDKSVIKSIFILPPLWGRNKNSLLSLLSIYIQLCRCFSNFKLLNKIEYLILC